MVMDLPGGGRLKQGRIGAIGCVRRDFVLHSLVYEAAIYDGIRQARWLGKIDLLIGV